jgi:hypothetical protein
MAKQKKYKRGTVVWIYGSSGLENVLEYVDQYLAADGRIHRIFAEPKKKKGGKR